MNSGATCALKKPGKEGARNCALNLLTKVMNRSVLPGAETSVERGYSAEDIESIIFRVYPSRDTYLSKIARIALHLSLFTRTGKVSYTFQDHIYGGRSNPRDRRANEEGEADDYLEYLVTTARDEEVFPELYLSGDYITREDRNAFETNMQLEHASILSALQIIVRKCCDSRVCTVDEMSSSYDQELFKEGSVFTQAAKTECIARKVSGWSGPVQEIFIPDSTPLEDRVILPSAEEFRTGGFPPEISSTKRTDPRVEVRRKKNYNEIRVNQDFIEQEDEEEREVREATADPRLRRNFDISGQVTCLNVDNLIHELAVLPKGKLLQLWDGIILQSYIQQDLMEKYRVEVGMRRYYLSTLSR